jgi:hypothetical protein
MIKSRSAWSAVPAEVYFTSVSSEPSLARPAPTFCRLASTAPKYDGVVPKWPVHTFSWNGSHARPSTAIIPSLLNAISGSLFPVEFAFGAVVTPVIGSVEIKGVLVNAGIGVGPDSAVGRDALAPAPAGCRATAAVASTANGPNNGNLLRIRIPFPWGTRSGARSTFLSIPRPVLPV